MDYALGYSKLGRIWELISAEETRSAVGWQHGPITAWAYQEMQPAFRQVAVAVTAYAHNGLIITWIDYGRNPFSNSGSQALVLPTIINSGD